VGHEDEADRGGRDAVGTGLGGIELPAAVGNSDPGLATATESGRACCESSTPHRELPHRAGFAECSAASAAIDLATDVSMRMGGHPRYQLSRTPCCGRSPDEVHEQARVDQL
jgi:hypothetical protein